jgi:hypothetical protein
VCVTPEVRTQTASDNAAAASRKVAAGPSGGAPQPAASYRTSEWSTWKRTAGIEYRYRWGWNPKEGRYATNVDAIFQLRNRTNGVWQGAARSVDCSQNVLSRSTNAVLQANETREVKFLTPNCGTLQNPWFKPDIVRSGRIDWTDIGRCLPRDRQAATRSWMKVKVRHEGVFLVGGIRNVDALSSSCCEG